MKRRRLSSSDTIEVVEEQDIKEEIKEEIEVEAEDVEIEVREDVREVVEVGIEVVRDEIECQADVICVQGPDTDDSIVVEGDSDGDSREIRAATAPVLPVSRRMTRSSRSCITVAHPPTSPLSSPPPDDIVESPLSFKELHRNRIEGMTTVPPSSSPLSSPPPVLFDPYDATSSDDHSAHSTSPSETDDSPPSTNPFSASQSSGRALPNMKGKDMFDASIWSDPLRTSIFYQFATSLRQKSKDAEPTVSHRFIKHLRDRGKLVRCYTQNIDQIEEKVGLSTCLHEGPGSRGRFSRKSTATINQLAMMVEETTIGVDPSIEKSQQSSDESSQQTQPSSDGIRTPNTGDTDQSPSDTPKADQLRRDLRPGVECVYLHGSLQRLRCFLCGRVCDWDDRETETLSGQQPECPFCVCATIAREEKGKRALGVGKLRPDIVLYGEEHPNSHLISPIITHDLALCPDILLILGTSLRVHGLKFMVREFAKAVHSKGGKVVFVNFTKPPESSWGDVIDYWIEWDCDAWVADLQDKIPRLWKAPEPPKPKRKREEGASDDGSNKRIRKYAKNPSALRPTKAVACVQVLRILDGLHKTTGAPPRTPMKVRATQPAPAPKAAITVKNADDQRNTARMIPSDTTKIKVEDVPTTGKKVRKPRPRRARMSAPGVLQPSQPEDATSTPNDGRTLRSGSVQPPKIPRLTGNGFELIKKKFVPRPLMEPEPQQSPSMPEPQPWTPSVLNPQPSTPSILRPQPSQRSLPRPQSSQRSHSQPQQSRRSLPGPSMPEHHLPEPVLSIGAFIKSNPRSRKRKNVFGEASPSADGGDAGAGSKPPVIWSAPVRGWAYEVVPEPPKLQLPDSQGYSPPHTRSGHKRPTPIEPSRIHQPLPEPPSDRSPTATAATELHQPYGSPLASYQHHHVLASDLQPLRPMSNNPQRTLHAEAYKLHDPLLDCFPRPTPPHSPLSPPPPSQRLPEPPAEQENSRRITRSSVAPVEQLKRIAPRLTVPEDAARRPRSPEDLMAAETLAGMGRLRQPPPATRLRDWGDHWPLHGVQSGL